jgi:hypothetical protein
MDAASYFRSLSLSPQSFRGASTSAGVDGMRNGNGQNAAAATDTSAKSNGAEISGEEAEENDIECCAAMAAVGCDGSVGLHLGRLVETWSDRPATCAVQLAKVAGFGAEECAEVEERLRECSQRYS